MSRIDALSKSFEPASAEKRIYQNWIEKGYFRPEPDPDKKSYTIVIPPPNITGQLHMGHALDNTLQDILIRVKRMQGFAALWLPGTDHASIATEAKIVEKMRSEGVSKDDLGREGFLEHAWEWKHEYGGRIIEQLKRLGSSCDWSRERFTMDDGLSEAVQEVFIRLYEKGLIYRGERIINWCPHCLTSISDAEVEYQDKQGSFYHLKYLLSDGSGYLELATTRPETLLGDTAVAVNPDDPRFSDLVGKTVILPLVNKEIPIISDTYVDMDFGTGVVKITPAHDPNDFEVGLRHDLPVINVMTDDAKINHEGGKYEGLTREEARRRVVDDLELAGLLVKTEPHQHNIGACYRCQTVVEPRVSFQWFVKMKPLAEPAIDAVKNGETKFVPERFEKTYFNWMENIRDWCISRQLWWGHRIPAYYCETCGKIMVGKEIPDTCPDCGGTRFRQDEDTLDTWFSSALWPFSTLGWPNQTEDLKYFYPTSVLVTGYDIIFFWVARMIFSGIEHTGQVPFHTVFIHGIIRDSEGRKMSKSLGNGVDPLELINEYGADALRYALISGSAPGNDQRFQADKIEAGRNFINKIWNAFRFVVMNFDDEMELSVDNLNQNDLALEDKWILTRLQLLKEEVNHNLDKYELGVALGKIYSFLWEEYCDWFIEMCKARLSEKNSRGSYVAQTILNHVLLEAMQLLHPFMPFVTEEIFGHLEKSAGSVMVSGWPLPAKHHIFEQDASKMTILMDAVRSIRNVRTEMQVPFSRKINLLVVSEDASVREMFVESEGFLQRLAAVSGLETRVDKDDIPITAVTAVFDGGEIFMPLEDLIDIEKEIFRLKNEQQNLEKELARVRSKLANESFVSKAPAKVIDAEREKLVRYEAMFQSTAERLEVLNGL